MPLFVDRVRVYNDGQAQMDRVEKLTRLHTALADLRLLSHQVGIDFESVVPHLTQRAPAPFTMAISNAVPGERTVTIGRYVAAQDGLPPRIANAKEITIPYGYKFYVERVEAAGDTILAVANDDTRCVVVDPSADVIEYIGD